MVPGTIRTFCTPADVLETFQKMKYMKCVPRGRARKELYQMILEWDSSFKHFFAGLFNQLAFSSTTLGTWELADAAQLDKHNGKEGTLGIRLIMMLDPMGKAYYWLLHKQTRDLPTNFGYGFYEHRRREQAILVHHAVAGRLKLAASASDPRERHRFSFVTTLRDISNAFPSLSHDDLASTINSTTDPWIATQLRARHEKLHVRVTTKQGEQLIYNPRQGGAQGDRVMPVQFRRAYEKRLAQWIQDKREDLTGGVLAVDPLTKITLDVSTTSYADDVKEINVASSAEEARDIIARSGALLDSNISPATLAQNMGKAEHVASFCGLGQDSHTKKLSQYLEENNLGKLKPTARYLGAWPQHNCSTLEVVDRRCRAAKESFYGMGKAWSSSISRKIKIMTFKNLVVNTLLSGLEAETLQTCNYEKLEKRMLSLGRKVVGKDGIYVQDGTRRQHSNSRIRELLQISSCFLELRIRRLQWILDILQYPSHNIQLRAALGGRIKLEHCEIEVEFTPWLMQAKHDLEWLIAESFRLGRTLDRDRAHEGHTLLRAWTLDKTLILILDPRSMRWFRSMSIQLHDLRCHTDPVYPESAARLNAGEIQCEETLEDGTPCAFVGRPADVGVHKYYHHGKCNPMKAIIVSNVCPGCDLSLASIKSAKEHANRTWKNGVCSRHKISRPYSHTYETIIPQLPLTCNLCKAILTTQFEVSRHMRSHFRNLAPRQFPNPDAIESSEQSRAGDGRQAESSEQSGTSSGLNPDPTSLGLNPDQDREASEQSRTSLGLNPDRDRETSEHSRTSLGLNPDRDRAGSLGPDPVRSSWRSRKFPKPDPKQQTLSSLFKKREDSNPG